ncbi:hypothetical protein [Megalodesulfovibrio paquesii]
MNVIAIIPALLILVPHGYFAWLLGVLVYDHLDWDPLSCMVLALSIFPLTTAMQFYAMHRAGRVATGIICSGYVIGTGLYGAYKMHWLATIRHAQRFDIGFFIFFGLIFCAMAFLMGLELYDSMRELRVFSFFDEFLGLQPRPGTPRSTPHPPVARPAPPTRAAAAKKKPQ